VNPDTLTLDAFWGMLRRVDYLRRMEKPDQQTMDFDTLFSLDRVKRQNRLMRIDG
jgi:hypothetical protein